MYHYFSTIISYTLLKQYCKDTCSVISLLSPSQAALLKSKNWVPQILQCLCIPQSQRLVVRACLSVVPKLLLQFVVNEKMENLVEFFIQKYFNKKPAGIKEFVFGKQFKKSVFTLNSGRELCPTSLVQDDI